MLIDGLAALFVATREGIMMVAAATILSSADDLLVDAAYVTRRIRRHLTVYRRHDRCRIATLRSGEPRPMAIFVPAWDEAAVIGDMLRHLTGTLDYPDYRIFVGTYPNDPATAAAVDAVGDTRIRRVCTGHDGPTTKADCLNELWRDLLAHEQDAGIRFGAIVLHDAEDLADANELRVYDHLIGRLSMVQLPVVPLPDRHSRWVAGHYMDEFAEAHGKEIVVREALGAAVPSAGVACAIERGMLGDIADRAGGLPFDPACLTEDYELGHRIHMLGGRGALVRIRNGRGFAVVATREHFPGTFRAAVRQKSRWLLGIAFQGWDRLGWPGNWANIWMLARDRKSLLTAALTLAGYAFFAMAMALSAIRAVLSDIQSFPPLIEPGGAAATMLGINAFVLAWRLAVRAAFTSRVHGWREGLRSLPRAVVGNVINCAAATRALRRYIRIALGREAVSWDKTSHAVHRQGDQI